MLKKEIGKLFPNLNAAIAYYSPTSFCITLNNISEAEYKTLFAKVPDKKTAEAFSVLNHEMRHNLDHLGTLWGQKHIKKLSEALNARLSGNEKEFFKIITLKAEERQLHYATYYTEHYNVIPWTKAQGNWTLEFSTGIKFNHKGEPDASRPIMFIKFSTYDRRPLVRVPLSVASLLETNSTKEELDILGGFINTLSGDEKIIEKALFETKTFREIIYNQKLALYNAAVHLTANLLSLTDVIIAFQISSAIATLTLNLPLSILNRIPLNENDIQTWGDRPKQLIENGDYGYIFYMLVKNYKPYFKADGEYNLSRLLIANNLPAEVEIEKLILEEFETFSKEYESQPNLINNMKVLVEQGKRFLKAGGIDRTKASISDLISKHEYRPHIICNDTDFPATYQNIEEIFKQRPIDNLNPIDWYNFSLIMDTKLDEFFEIRGL